MVSSVLESQFIIHIDLYRRYRLLSIRDDRLGQAKNRNRPSPGNFPKSHVRHIIISRKEMDGVNVEQTLHSCICMFTELETLIIIPIGKVVFGRIP
jgi:hypothetical protein